jgi:hypothetical protein
VELGPQRAGTGAVQHPGGRSDRWTRLAGRPWLAPAAVGAAITAGTLAIAAIGPSDDGPPVCLSRVVVGSDCPFCGGLRCVGALARGDLVAAADHNLLLAVALPVLAIGWTIWMLGTLRHRPVTAPRVPPGAWILLLVVVLGFTVARNLGDADWMQWLASDAWADG